MSIASAQQFIVSLGDVPIMSDMQVNHDSQLIFETVAGRIIEVEANISNWEKTKSFYQETLPSLGWQEVTEMHFIRDDEYLTLTQTNATGLLISLAPKF